MAKNFVVLILLVVAMVMSSALTVLYLDRKSDTIASSIDEETIGKLVENYISKNPEIVVEGIRKAQAAEKVKQAKDATKNIKDVLPQLSARKAAAGSDNGKVTVAVFHDYNCGYCRKAIPDVEKLAEADKDVKIVIVDLPILGDMSVTKGNISTAVALIDPSKGFEFYKQLSNKSPRTEKQIYAIVADMGLNVDQVKDKADSPEVSNLISENRSIAQKLGVRGTPAFVIGEEIVRGAQGYKAFQAAVDRQKS